MSSECPLTYVLVQYGETFSKVPWQQFPGGQYKASTTATLKTTTIAGQLWRALPSSSLMSGAHPMRD